MYNSQARRFFDCLAGGQPVLLYIANLQHSLVKRQRMFADTSVCPGITASGNAGFRAIAIDIRR